ncbi:HAMP domain-containing histidine kinase [Nocardioides panacis]|uniref:histidine kinase n=1 Tax=Nocardioides panacis TaxID=2849501 RepID=A0A975Y1X6_9ACTN|nr:HAMP domain-containing sensor histidine kinase [Nocardioides panacis]QWZ09966.1 HAMP domain-containing histidine kinase [Nocardioides panacis]
MWITALVTVAAMAAMILAVILVVTRVTQGRVDASLRDRIAATKAATTRTGDGGLRVTGTAANEVIDSVWVFDSDGTQVSGPRAGSRVQSTVESLSGVTRTTRVELRDRVYVAEPIRLRGERRASGVAVAEQSTRPYEDTQTVLVGGLVVLGVLVSGVTATITAWTVRRTLRPVQRMTELAAEWNDQDLDSRFRLGAGTDEFSQLGNTLDALLDRVAEALRNEQQLTAELAHELRTPLTTIRAEAELGTLSDVDDATRDRLHRVMAQVDRLDRTITTLLALARHQHGAARTADLGAVLSGLVEPLAGANGAAAPVTVSYVPRPEAGSLRIHGDAELVERVLAPVLDNAVRYATSAVRIEVRRSGGDVLVQVCDDGPGIDSTFEDDVFLAGVGDPTTRGAGLGLPLSRRVAAGLGGSVQVVSYRDPTVVQVRLPTA